MLGLAVGFGAQRLVRDVITGLFILGEGQFDVGDWVTIGGVSGRVEDIGLRVTRLRDEQGRAYIIANGDITQVSNASRGPIKKSIEICLDRASSLEDGLTMIRQIADETLREFAVEVGKDESPAVMVVGMEAAKVTVRLVFCAPIGQLAVVEDTIRRRLLESIAHHQDEFTLA